MRNFEIFIFVFHDKYFDLNIIGVQKSTILYRDDQMKEQFIIALKVFFPKRHQYKVLNKSGKKHY